MTSPLTSATAPFGRVLVAMVTPFTNSGDIDLAAAVRVAKHVVDSGVDGLVLSGTTGESPTLTIDEAADLWARVKDAVGDRASILAGVGTNNTAHSIELAKKAAHIGVDGMLIVTPYYSKPSQAGIINHISLISAAGADLPIMLYDIPGRTGVELSVETIHTLAKMNNVVALKDASGNLERGAELIRDANLAIYSGDDVLNLSWLSIGAVGIVSVAGHVTGADHAAMVAAVDAGDLDKASEINEKITPAVDALMTIIQGAASSKAALQLLGVLNNRAVRPPLLEASDAEVALIKAGLQRAGYLES